MKKILTMDVWIGIALMLLSVWFWILAGAFPKDAQMFPKFFLAANFILSVILIASTVIRNKKLAAQPETVIPTSDIIVIISAYLIISVYVVCINFIGFYVSSSLFLVAFMLFLNTRSIKTLVCVTVGMDVFLFLLFNVGLKLNLPSGLLF